MRVYAILQSGPDGFPMKMILMLKLIMKNSALALSTIVGCVIWP
jgi:hypothetical protein